MQASDIDCNKKPSNQVPTISRRGLRPGTSVVDRDLWLWYCATNDKQNGKKVSKQLVQARAKWAFHRAGILEFKASDGWYRRWISRWRHYSSENNVQNADITNQKDRRQFFEVGKQCDSDIPDQQLKKTVVDNTGLHPKVINENFDSELGMLKNSRTKDSQEVSLRNPLALKTSTNPETALNNYRNVVDSVCFTDTCNKRFKVSEKVDFISKTSYDISGSNDNRDSMLFPSVEGSCGSCTFQNNNSISASALGHCSAPCISAAKAQNQEITSASRKKCAIVYSEENMLKASSQTFNKKSAQPSSSYENENSDSTFLSSENSEESVLPVLCETDDSSHVSLCMTKPQDNSDSISVENLQPRKVIPTFGISDPHLKFQKNGKRYLPHFKDKVLSYVANHTFKETAKKFHVHQGSITTWKKDKARKKLTSRRSSGKSKDSIVPIDEQFLDWLHHQQEFTSTEVQDYARQLIEQYGGNAVAERQARWFALWVRRFEEKPYHEGMENTRGSGEDDRRIQYPPAFRMEVARFAKKFSQTKASRIFNVSRRRVFDWLKLYKDKDNSEKGIEGGPYKTSSGRTVTDGNIDQQIWSWYQDQLAEGRKPKGQEVRSKGLALYHENGHAQIHCSYGWYKRWCDRFGVVLRHDGDDAVLEWTLTQLDRNRSLTHHDLQVHAKDIWSKRNPNFKASAGWAIRFCKRHPKLLQQTPTVQTPLPQRLQSKVEEFRSMVQVLVAAKSFSSSTIGCMDELHLNFSAPLSGNSKRHLLLRKPGSENCHATIVLACLADGNMLPPAIILKNSLEGEVCEKTNSNLLVFQQEDGVLDTVCMNRWLNQVWFKYVKGPNLLLADCYDPHSTREVKEKFIEQKSEIRIIPGGCTSKLQPLDIGTKQNFKQTIEKQWTKLNLWSCTGKFHLPTSNELLEWSKEAHELIQASRQEMIRQSFVVTGLTATTCHSEDHYMEVIPSDDGDL